MPLAAWDDVDDTEAEPAPQRASFADILSVAPPAPRRHLASFNDVLTVAPPTDLAAPDPFEQSVIASSPATLSQQKPTVESLFGLKPGPVAPPPAPVTPSLWERMGAVGDPEVAYGEIAAPAARDFIMAPTVGVPQMGRGAAHLVTGEGGRMNAASDIIEGGMKASEPLIAAAAVSSPLAVARALLLGYAGQAGTEAVARGVGLSPDAQRLAGNVGGLVVPGVAEGALQYRRPAAELPGPRAVEPPARETLPVEPPEPVAPQTAHVEDVVAIAPPPAPIEPPAIAEPPAAVPGVAHVADVVDVVTPAPASAAADLTTMLEQVKKEEPRAEAPTSVPHETPPDNAAAPRDVPNDGAPVPEAAAAPSGVAHVDDVVAVEPPAAEPAGEEKKPKREPRSVRAEPREWTSLQPRERREVRRILEEMSNWEFTPKQFNETVRRGGDLEVSAGAGGAPVYWDIVGGDPKSGRPIFRYDRGKVKQKLRAFIEQGKRSVVSDLASDVAVRRLAGDRTLSEPSMRVDAGELPGDIFVDLSKGVAPEHAARERAISDRLEAEPQKYLRALRDEYSVISTDHARTVLLRDFPEGERAQLNTAAQRPAQALMEAARREAIAAPVPEGKDSSVIMVGGATGVGKSSALRDVPGFSAVHDNAAVRLEGTYKNYDTARRHIREARANGHQVAFIFVDREPVAAFERGVLARSGDDFRPVTPEFHATAHAQARETLGRLVEEFKDDPGVEFMAIDNNGPKGSAHVVHMDDVTGRSYNDVDVRRSLEEVLTRAEAGEAGLSARARAIQSARAGLRSESGGGIGEKPQPERPEGPSGPADVSQAIEPTRGDRVHVDNVGEGEVRQVVTAGRPGGTGIQRQRRRALVRLTDADGQTYEQFHDLDKVRIVSTPKAPPAAASRYVDPFEGTDTGKGSAALQQARKRAAETGEPYYITRDKGGIDAVMPDKPGNVPHLRVEPDGRVFSRSGALLMDATKTVADKLDTGEEQPRLPGAGEARQVGKADTSFRAPAQASGDDFSLSALLTDEQRAKEAKEAAGPSMFDDDEVDAPSKGPREMPNRGKRADASGALVPSPASRAIALVSTEKQLRPSEIVREISKSLDALPVKVGKFRQHALGIYKPQEQTIRLKVANDLDTLAHEVGHHIHETVIGHEVPIRGGRAGRKLPYGEELLQLGAPTSRSSYTIKERMMEGQAEFTRYYFSDPAEAKRLAPVYYQAFEEGLRKHPELAAVVARAQRQYVGFLSQDPVTRGLSHLDFDGVDPSPKTDTLTRLQTAWVDDLYPVRRMVEDLSGDTPIDYTRNGYVLARLARGASAKADGFLRHGVRAADGTFVAGALEPALAPVRKQIKEFAGYLAALRALELRRRGMETGMTAEEARAIVDKFKSPTFDAARDAVYQYQDALLVYATHAGTLSTDQLAAIKKLNRAYVPFQRVIDDVGAAAGAGPSGLANKGTPVKRIKGSGRDIINPLESIIRNTHTLVAMVEQNRAMSAIVRQAQTTVGGGRYIEAIPEKKVGTTFNLSMLEKDIRAHLAEQGIDLELSSHDMFDKLVTVFTPAQFRMGEKGVVSVLRDGERQWFQVNDQALYDAIAAIVPKTSDLVTNLFIKPARWLRAGATTTVGFIARNPIRDTFEAAVNSRYGFHLGYDTIRGLAEFIKKGDDYQNFLNSGAGNASMVGMDRNRLRQELVKLGATDRRRFADSVVLNPINLLQAVSEAMEHATRLGEFKRGVEAEGRTAEGYARAALAARDVTLDFARGGSVSKEVNRYTAFFNAGMQGTARLAEVFKQDPVGATFRATAAITLPTLMLYALNQDDPTYRELPDWERNTYWHIPIGRGAGHDWARVPKPFSLGQIFANAPEALLDWFAKRDPEALARILPDRQTAWKQLISILPTALMPAVEVATNYDTFRDRALVNPADVNLDTALQYNRWTSAVARYVGPKIGIPPAKLDHLIYGYGAGLASGIVQGADRAGEALGLVEQKKPAGGIGRAPLLGTFYRETPGAESRSLEQFYRLRDRVEGAVGSIKRYEKAGEAQALQLRQAQAREELGPNAAATLERVRAADKAMTGVRDDVNRVFANPRLDPDEKKELLDRLYERMVNIARQVLDKPLLPSRFQKPAAPALLQKLETPKPPVPVAAKPATPGVESRTGAKPPLPVGPRPPAPAAGAR